MRASTAVAIALLALLLWSPGAVAAAHPSAAQPTTVDAPDGDAAADLDQHRQLFAIELTGDGDARWTIESRYVLESDEDVADFRAYADEVTSGERSVDYDERTFQRFAERAAAGTDREMQIEAVGWGETTVEPITDSETPDGEQRRLGTIRYTFTWTNFADVRSDELVLGDVFWANNETWFPALTETQRLEITAPDNYAIEDAPRPTTNLTIAWDGPHEFERNEIQVTYVERAAPPTGSESPTPNATTEPPGGTEGGFPTLVTGVGLFALLCLVGAGGYYVARYGSDDPGRGAGAEATAEGSTADGPTAASSAAGSAGAGPSPDESVEYESPGADVVDADSDADGAAGAGSGVGAGAGADTDTTPDDDVDVELLSDEERVHRLLRQNNGRMKQAMIVEETGWSNAKVSQLLSQMHDDEEIEKLRIGRENLITLPEVDPTEME